MAKVHAIDATAPFCFRMVTPSKITLPSTGATCNLLKRPRVVGLEILPQVLGVSPWVIIPLFAVGALLLFRFFEKRRL
jgi:hypothetical protein